MKSRDYPANLVCPCTGLIFLRPVVLLPSYVVVEAAVADQIMHGDKLCPVTGEKIIDYRADYDTQERIASYLEKHPEARQDRYKTPEVFSRPNFR